MLDGAVDHLTHCVLPGAADYEKAEQELTLRTLLILYPAIGRWPPNLRNVGQRSLQLPSMDLLTVQRQTLVYPLRNPHGRCRSLHLAWRQYIYKARLS